MLFVGVNLTLSHGIAMATAWLLFFPAGGFIARFKLFGDSWFNVHRLEFLVAGVYFDRASQIIGSILVLSAFILAFIMCDGSHFQVG